MFRPFFAIFALTLAVPLAAHEGHKDDKSDAEMAAEMSAQTVAETAAPPINGKVPYAMEGELHAPRAPARTPEETYEALVEANRVDGVEDLLGRLHPMAAHFPIALLLLAALAELLFALRPALALQGVVRLALATGALGAVFAALLGWLAAGWRLTDRSDLLGLHRWNGTLLALASIVAWWLASRASDHRTALRLLLGAIAAATAFQGYLGGEMVFGPNHLGLR